MNTMFTVALREITSRLRKPSFYLTSLLMPLLVAAIFFGISVLNVNVVDNVDPGMPSEHPSQPSGYVDHADVIQAIPFDLHMFFIPYSSEAQAADALRTGTIESYFVVAADYVQSGHVERVVEQATLTSAGDSYVQAFEALLLANLAGDPALARRISHPLDLQTELVGATDAPRQDEQGVPFNVTSLVLGILLVFSIINGGGWLVQAVVEEKENRTIEVILTSVRPLHLMAGKLLGLGSLALLQLLFWIMLSGGALGIVAAVGISTLGGVPISVWLWMIVFFLLGFAFYGGLLMVLGAVGASMREVGQISGFMTLPVVAPLWFVQPLAESPNGTLAQVLSYIPFTAPLTMMLRLGVTSVPVWQIMLSVLSLLLAVVVTIWLAARIFRSSTLLSGTKPTPRAVWRAMRGV